MESLTSDATVVETTSQALGAAVDVDDDDDRDTGVGSTAGTSSTAVRSSSVEAMRSRKGSYTLDHPSPSLVAYMYKTGKTGMETPRLADIIKFYMKTTDSNLPNGLVKPS